MSDLRRSIDTATDDTSVKVEVLNLQNKENKQEENPNDQVHIQCIHGIY